MVVCIQTGGVWDCPFHQPHNRPACVLPQICSMRPKASSNNKAFDQQYAAKCRVFYQFPLMNSGRWQGEDSPCECLSAPKMHHRLLSSCIPTLQVLVCLTLHKFARSTAYFYLPEYAHSAGTERTTIIFVATRWRRRLYGFPPKSDLCLLGRRTIFTMVVG